MDLSKNFDWRVKLGIFLIVLSSLLYISHYLIFNDAHSVLFYIGADIAFLPIEVLFVLLLKMPSATEKKVDDGKTKHGNWGILQ